jgi:hypothetical protein
MSITRTWRKWFPAAAMARVEDRIKWGKQRQPARVFSRSCYGMRYARARSLQSAVTEPWSAFEEIALHYLRTIFRWVAAVSAFFGFGAIVAEMLKRWMENNGYLDHPEKGIAWVLSTLASISLYWWFIRP